MTRIVSFDFGFHLKQYYQQPSQFATAKSDCLRICFRPCQLRRQMFAVDVFSMHIIFLFIRYGLFLSQIKMKKKIKKYLFKCSLKCLSFLYKIFYEKMLSFSCFQLLLSCSLNYYIIIS